MKSTRIILVLAVALAATGLLALQTQAQDNAVPAATIQKNIDNYIRHLYAFGPDVKLTVGPLKQSEVPGLLETMVELTLANNHQSAEMFVSKDGRYLFRGELADMSKDPLAAIRAKLQTDNAPSRGPLDAKVTIVEFADFECPVCRQLHDVMEQILPKYPQVRLIFKDYPIEEIHPWAKTAALAGRCAYDQNPEAFWKMYDLLYNNQDVITADDAWDQIVGFAGQTGLNTDTFKTCMASPQAAAAINASIANAKLLDVNSTPTLFIDGRRIVGADGDAIEKYIQYDLPKQKAAKAE